MDGETLVLCSRTSLKIQFDVCRLLASVSSLHVCLLPPAQSYLLPARRITLVTATCTPRQTRKRFTSAFSWSLRFLHTPYFILHTHCPTPASVSRSPNPQVSESPTLDDVPLSPPVVPCHSPVAALSLTCQRLSHDCRDIILT